MTLAESILLLRQTDCKDLEVVATALTLRARAIAEFAATADPLLLASALQAGEEFLTRLETTQMSAYRELDNLRKLKHGLVTNLDAQVPEDQLVFFG